MLPDLAAPGLINAAPVVHLPITASPITIPSASSKSAERVVACLQRSSSPTASPRTPSPTLPTPLPSEHGIQFKKGRPRAASTSSVPLLRRACTISGCSRAAPAAVGDGWSGTGRAAPRRPCRAQPLIVQPRAAPPLPLHSLPVAWSLDSCRCSVSGEAAGGEPNDPEQRAKPRKADHSVMRTFVKVSQRYTSSLRFVRSSSCWKFGRPTIKME
ncbi:uncharacterized protein [Triticum aestivum]|uniref:uncharacterized protein n=1 Tax=Triticum aestivum TaxID=4565 RepID=UPI001D022D28|nr:uncharacterized protein LOC123165499 [Triticum aestivum]